MPEETRTISDTWAILKADGSVAGDGEISLDYFSTREHAGDELQASWDYLTRINESKSFRVARVRLLEVVT